MHPCPICKNEVQERPNNRSFPFCSARCQTVDLGRWLQEGYRVPVDDDTMSAGAQQEKGLS
ncbi:MAG: DNA gyrase inhibitor YacG [Myxococcales bacterium]